MTTKKVLTAKKHLPCLIIDPKGTGVTWAVIRRSDGTFGIHDSTNYIDPINPPKGYHANHFDNLKSMVDFDEQPFIDAFNNYQQEKETARIKKQYEAIEAEEKRVSELKARIERCETPIELVQEFRLTWVETAGHWSDLYEERSGHAILIGNREEKEIVDMAIDIHGAEGEWGESRNRAGEHHNTFSSFYCPELNDYQEALQRHFSGDHYFYKSQEDDSDFYLNTVIKDIMEDEDKSDFEKLEAIKESITNWEEIEAGYYDCNGNLEMSEKDLKDADITGYTDDVYTFNYAFRLDHNYSWSAPIENENEEE